MLTIQIFLLVFFLIAILKVISRYRAGEISGYGAAIWIFFWLLAGVVVVVPNSTFILARAVGIGRGADLIVYAALALIFFILFRIMVKMEKINRDITKLTRKMASDEKDGTPTVIPAKAGIHGGEVADSRFRGNDRSIL